MSRSRSGHEGIVRYWQAVEYFTPQKVDRPKRGNGVSKLAAGVSPPWSRTTPTPAEYVWRYTVFGGIFKIDHVSEMLDAVLGAADDGVDSGARRRGDTALVSLTLDENGRLFKESVTMSSCAWALGRTVGQPGPGADDWLDGFVEQQKQILKVLFDIGDDRIPVENGRVSSRGERVARLIAGVGSRVAIDVAIGGIASLAGIVGDLVSSHVGQTAGRVAESVTDSVADDATSTLEQCRDNGGSENAAEQTDADEAEREPLGSKQLDLDDLVAIVRFVSEAFGVDEVLAPDQIWVKRYRVPRRKADDVSGDELMNSFYAADLARVADEISAGRYGAALTAYLSGERPETVSRRIDVRAEPSVLLDAVHPAEMPLGRWPADPARPLALSQQFAINTVMRELGGSEAAGVYAVNGPPGTGKTTLLRDLVAAVVVDRATVLAGLPSPRAAFTQNSSHRWQEDRWPRTLTPLADALTGFEIVFASSNNGAVENISLEVPVEDAIDRSAFPEAGYLAATATNVTSMPCWAALAARLGRRSFRKDFIDRFWWGPKVDDTTTGDDAEPIGMRNVLTAAMKQSPAQRVRQWRDAVDAFDRAIAEARALADARADVARDLAWLAVADHELQMLRASARGEEDRIAGFQNRLSIARARVEKARVAWEGGKANLAGRELDWRCADADVGRCDAVVARAQRELHAHEATRPGFWKRLISRDAGTQWSMAAHPFVREVDSATERRLAAEHERDRRATEWRRAQQDLTHLEREVRAADAAVATCLAEREALTLSVASARQEVTRHEAEIAMALSRIEQARRDWPGHVPGPEWQAEPADRSAMERRELSAPWMDAQFAATRSRVFLAALDLHRATLLAEPEIASRNLHAAASVIVGEAPTDLPEASVRAAWQMLFFVVPAVSTTFASLPTMFVGLGQETIGWLCIDEAGQAAPQAAVGALWRARRAVIVGDPRQLEPVVTLPWAGQQRLARAFDVDLCWAPGRTSVQAVADSVTRFGTWLPDLDSLDQIWVGSPLRVHRRCGPVMFEVSNAIAYDQMMVYGVEERPPFELAAQDLWIDVPADADGGKWNEREGRQVLAILRKISSRISDAMDAEAAEHSPEWAATHRGRDEEQHRRLEESVFIVTPFRDVMSGLSSYLRREEMAIGSSRLGTVHTTQGKEADIVIIVLGTADDDKGSRRWAAQTPNLLNVAVTRAKRRLFVVGDYENWSTLRNFSVLAAQAREGGPMLRWRPRE